MMAASPVKTYTARQLRSHRLLLGAGLLAAWEVFPRLGWLDPLFIPPLGRVLETIVEQWRFGALAHHTLLSAGRVLGGFAIALVVGPLLGLALGGWFARLREALEPLFGLFAQANPVVLFHVVLLFFGIGESAKVFLIAWLCVWPITFSAMAGVRQVERDLLRVARAFGLSRFDLFFRVAIPYSLPSLFTGIRLAAGYAFVMLIAAEMMGASSGLGWLVVQYQQSYHPARIFAAAAMISALAFASDRGLKAIETRLLRWHSRPGQEHALLADLKTC
jgi:NitT/TauT family transport system permease protein